ncbi:glycosyltransferase family 4 protein [Sphingomonas cavernae]|uniref:Glycosyltransferase family 4 protein n=1 Tax=Sphingomonas cavernae TaxID=2320861 RepID=A0A418WSR8_9SPHN|nr:glycosyltransferase family 4 protein [Sphingomonas cavernae]RJF94255.1 glycosyltransferase family 4 protein [Sphingomonas cavernae]
MERVDAGIAGPSEGSGHTPLHIVFVLSALGAGGAERVVSLIASRWAARGDTVTVIAFDGPDDPIYHDFDSHVRFVRLGVSTDKGGKAGAMLRSASRAWRLRRALKRLAPDRTISFLTKVNVLTLLATLGSKRRVIISERNNLARQAMNPLWRRLAKALYGRADAIVMQTEPSIACLPRGARARAVVIPNPLCRIAAREVPPGMQHLVAVGRLEAQKGFDLLINAFARISDLNPRWALVIYGEGPERSALEAQIRKERLDGRVLLAGLSTAPGAWIEQGSIFVLSSRFEGFPNVLGEAMAAGLPVVAFDCAFGPGEMINNGVDGILIPDGRVGALADTLTHMMRDPELRARLGAAAAQSAMRFAPDRVIARWDAVVARSPTAHELRSEAVQPAGAGARA